MRLLIFFFVALYLTAISCKKSNETLKSKTDYIPIVSANSPLNVKQGEQIVSHVKCGYYDHWADITFLNFEMKENLPKQFEIRAKGFYSNILSPFSLPVVSTIDTAMSIKTTVTGQYFLKFYDFNKLVQTDTVIVE